jgi:hypothetical protein
MSTKKLLKKLGYGHSIHYNLYRKKFEVYKIGEWAPGTEITTESRVMTSCHANKAIKKYIKKFRFTQK